MHDLHIIAPSMMQSVLLEIPNQEIKPPIDNFRSFGSADYSEVNLTMEQAEFEAVCYSTIDNMCNQFYEYLEKIIGIYVPRRARHCQSLPPWITLRTSNLMKRLKTRKRQLKLKPTSYRRNLVTKMQNLVTEAAEYDRVMNQEKVMSTRDTNLIFKHLKSLSKSTFLPKVMTRNGVASVSLQKKG